LKLTSGDLTTYTGEIEIESDSGDNEIKGDVVATLKREGNTLYGPIRVTLDGSAANDMASLEGVIKIALSEKASEDSFKGMDGKVESKPDSSDSKDKSESNSGSSDRGFWKKFFSFFGAN
jgi:hypothetical protein